MQVEPYVGSDTIYFSYHDINAFFKIDPLVKEDPFVKRIYNHCNKHLPTIKKFHRYDTGCLAPKQHFVYQELQYLCSNYKESHHTNIVNQIKGRELRQHIKARLKIFRKYLDKLDVNRDK
jgi:hypothetical protein